MNATLERTETKTRDTRDTWTIDAKGNVSTAKVVASTASFANMKVIAGGSALAPQHTAAPIREFETG